MSDQNLKETNDKTTTVQQLLEHKQRDQTERRADLVRLPAGVGCSKRVHIARAGLGPGCKEAMRHVGAHSLGTYGATAYALTLVCLAIEAVVDTSLGRFTYPVSRFRGSTASALPAQESCHHR